MKKSLALKVFNLLLIVAVVFMNFTGVFATVSAAENEEIFADELFISEYVEGSSFNKAIEIYNGTSSAVDLSEYQVALYSNGAETATQTLNLSGTLEHGDVLVLAHGSSDDPILAVANVTNNAVINFNGDDAISLNKNDDVIDIVGQIGVRENFGQDVTLVRVAGVTEPTTSYNTNEWDAYASNTFAYLGSHIMDGVTPVDPPEEPGEPDPEAGEYSIEEARNLADGTVVQVEGVVTVDNAAISNGAQFSTYIQDETAGINLFAYTQGELTDVVKGDKVVVTGELATYNGLKEVVPTIIEVVAQNQELPEPKQITLEDLQNPAVAENYEGQLVTVQGYINSVPGTPAGGGYNVSVIDSDFNGTTLRVMENSLDITQVVPGFWYDITAVVSQYNTYQLIPTEQADIVQSAEQPEPPSAAGYYEATVASVTDGDTIRIQDPVFGETRIRFLNMDTAETYAAKNKDPERAEINANQKYYGDLATQHILTLIQPGDKILLKVGDQPTDDYGRILAEVIRESDGMNVNLQMVKDGLASSYFIAPFDEESYPLYQDAVKEAKDAGLGIWNPENPLLELPFAFRANDDKKGFLRYVGNSDTMEYVEPNAWSTVPVEKRIFFSSAAEAEAYGFVPEGTVVDPDPEDPEEPVDPEEPEVPEEPEYVVVEVKQNNGTATVHNKELDAVNDGDHVLINIYNEKKPRDLLLNKKQVDLLKDKNVTLTVTDGVNTVTFKMAEVTDKVLKVSLKETVNN